jgi:hypothetical protein
MDKQVVINIQRAVGANIDGFMGEETLRLLFLKLGCPKQEVAKSLAINANVQFRLKGIMDDALVFAHFMAQCGVIVKGLYDVLKHSRDQITEFKNWVFSSQTKLRVTYIASKEKWMRTISNRTCWFSMSQRGSSLSATL